MIIPGKYWSPEWKEIPPSTRWLLFGISLISIVFVLMVANPFDYYFLNDDFQHIPLAAQGHFVFGQFLRPVSDILFWVENRIWSKTAPGYHLTNLCLHLLNVLVVFLLSRNLFEKYGGKGNALVKTIFVTLLFLVYGSHSETLFWILGRGGSLGSLFFLLACSAFLKRQQGIGWFLGSLLFFTLGLLSYESTWIYPLVMGMFILAEVKKGKNNLKAEMIYAGVTALGFALYLFFFIPRKAFFGNEYALHNLTDFHPLQLLYNYNTLLARTILPPMHESHLFLGFYLLVLSGMAVLFVSGIWKKKSSVLEYLAMGGLLVSILPEISLGISTHNSESERFVYLPSFFFIVWVVESGFQFIIKSRVVDFFIILLIIGHACLLSNSAASYRFAGEVVRNSLQALEEKRSVNSVYVIHLPIQYQGALIFRSGLPEVIKWICPGLQYENIFILDSFTFRKPGLHFFVYPMDLKPGLRMLGGKVLTNEGSLSQTSLSGHKLFFDQGKDMILYWNDSSLIKIN